MKNPAPKLTPADLEPPPRTPVPAWLVGELVRLGVPRATAEGYGMRQAYAVRASLKKRGGKR
jgi:hypothetical protein